MLLRLLKIVFCASIPGGSLLYSSRPWLTSFIPPIIIGTLWLANQMNCWASPDGVYALIIALLVIHGGSWALGARLTPLTTTKRTTIKIGAALCSPYLLCIILSIYYRQQVLPVTIYHIASTSMLPTLFPDDIIIVTYKGDTIAAGDVIVFKHPSVQGMHMIKRVNDKRQDELEVLGDNPKSSIDSRVFGRISSESVIGKATLLIRDGDISKIEKKTK